jgi:hypothetical protein
MASDTIRKIEELARKATGKTVDELEEHEAKRPRQLFLPGLGEFMRTMPNHIARSSLFAPIARGRKKYHNRTVITSRNDVEITFTGLQLDEAQADAWMQLLYEAKNTPLGEAVVIHRAAFLRAIGRTGGGVNYSWLENTFHAFTAATLVVKAKRKDGQPKYHVGHTRTFHMLAGYGYNEDKEEYEIIVDPRWKQIFGGKEYALMSWPKRLQIGRGQDLAKALQRLFASSNNCPQHHSLDWLQEWAQQAGRRRDFRSALSKAMDELKRLKIVDKWDIGQSTTQKEQLTIWVAK